MLEKLFKLCEPYVTPLEIDGLKGRKMVFPARDPKRKRQILFIYGIHGNMERFYGIVHFLARFGTVTMPDLPGFGGMDSFYRIGRKPNFDNYADYLAEFIKQQYGDEKIVLAGLSYGFVVMTRMLQRHPEMVDQVELAISVVGIADGNDFAISKKTRRIFMVLFWLFRHQPWTWLCYHVAFTKTVLNHTYRPNHPKMLALKPGGRDDFIEFEEHLWQINDLKTYGTAMKELFTFHHPDIQLPLDIHHIGTPHDNWLDDVHVRSELTRLYKRMIYHESTNSSHGGTAYDSEDEAREIVPPSVVKLLETS